MNSLLYYCFSLLFSFTALQSIAQSNWTYHTPENTGEHKFPSYYIEQLEPGVNGGVWIRYYGGSITFLKDGVFDNSMNTALPSSHNTSIEPSPDGSIWVSTSTTSDIRGLFTYNSGWTTHNSFTSNVNDVYVAASDSIWTAYDGGLTYFDGVNLTNYKIKDSLWKTYMIFDPVTFIYKDTLVKVPNQHYVNFIEKDNNHNLWVATFSDVQGTPSEYMGSLCRFDGQSYTIYKTGSGDSIATCMDIDAQNRIWYGSYKGLFLFDNGSIVKQNSVRNDTIHSVFNDLHGNVWVGTEKGVSMYNGSTWTNISYSQIPGRKITAITQDKDGVLWFASETGLTKYNQNIWYTYYFNDGGVSYDYFSDIHINKNNQVIASRTRWQISVYDNDMWNNYPNGLGLDTVLNKAINLNTVNHNWIETNNPNSLYKIYHDLPFWIVGNDDYTGTFFLTEDLQGTIYAMYYNFDHSKSGINVLSKNDNQSVFYELPVGLSSSSGKGVLWNHEIVYPFFHPQTKAFSIIRMDTATKAITVNQISVLPYTNTPAYYEIHDVSFKNNVLVVATNLGLIKYDGTTASLLTNEDGIVGYYNYLRSVTIDDNNKIWTGSNYEGITIVDLTTFTVEDTITEEDGLLNNTVTAMEVDQYGQIWMATGAGICVYNYCPITLNINDLTLTTNNTSGTIQWYKNNILIPDMNDPEFHIQEDGIYKVVVSYVNGCQGVQTLIYKGLQYDGFGQLNAPLVSGATYEWYLNNQLIEGDSYLIHTSANGVYKVLISYPAPGDMSTLSLQTATFYFKIENIITGVYPKSVNPFKIFPNPTSDNLYIDGKYKENGQIRLLDETGAEVKDFKFLKSPNMLNVEGLEQGIYFLQIIQPEEVGVYKIFIIR